MLVLGNDLFNVGAIKLVLRIVAAEGEVEGLFALEDRQMRLATRILAAP